MALRIFTKKFQLTQLRSLKPRLSLISNTFYAHDFTHTFHRTPSAHSYTLRFRSFQSSSPQSNYYPFEFTLLQPKIDQINDSGINKLVELVEKSKDFGSKEEAVDHVNGCGVRFDANEVCLAIWALKDDWELGLFAFELGEKWGLIDGKMLGLIVWVLGSHQKFDIAWSLIRGSFSFVDTRSAMLVVIERYAAANCHEKAIKTFQFLEKLSVSPDQNAMYTLLSALCKYGNVEEAEEFMLKNKKLFPLETEGFNIILHAWCTISVDIFQAKRVWREMASYCITPDAMSYTHLISCFSMVGKLFDTLRLYDEMKKRGWLPGLEVYNSLMYVMTCENCLSEGLKILEKMKEMGIQPDSRSYNCLICPLCELDKFVEARGLLSTMIQEGVRPTLETYKAFLNGGDLKSTMEILDKMKNDKIDPDCCTFQLIFDRFFKLGQPANVLKVWVEMKRYGVHADSTHYLSLIRGLINCGCYAKAKEMHTEMIANGFMDDPKLNKLLQGLEQSSHHQRDGKMNIVRNVDKSKPPSVHRGRKKQGRKFLKNNQKL